MRNVCLLISFLFLSFPLLAQTTFDKKAATMDLIQGFTDEYDNREDNKKYLSANMKLVWPSGWVSKSEPFWEHYFSATKRNKHEPSNIEIKEIGNETFSFFTWKSTVRIDNKHPEWIGTSAEGPIAYRMVWENNQIIEWHIFCDFKSRDQQYAEQAKAKVKDN